MDQPSNFLVINGIYCDNIHAFIPNYFAIELTDEVVAWLDRVVQATRETSSKDTSFEFSIFGFSFKSYWCIGTAELSVSDTAVLPLFGSELFGAHNVENCKIKVRANGDISFQCIDVKTKSVFETPIINITAVHHGLKQIRQRA